MTRHLLATILALAMSAASAQAQARPPAHLQQQELAIEDQPGYQPSRSEEELSGALQRQLVFFRTAEPAGTIVIFTSQRFLYVVQGNNRALRYGIGVGREGFQWAGLLKISRKAEWPDWTPPPEMIARQPYLPRFMAGGPGNPMGARALYLGSTIYRLHGTNQPQTIGHAVSSGCFRLVNDDIIDLYERDPGRNEGRRAPCARTVIGWTECDAGELTPEYQIMRRIAFLLAFGLAFASIAGPAFAQTLKAVKDRGLLLCGVSEGLYGFSAADDKGNWSGFDVDFCRAISAAIFNDPGKIKFVPLSAGDRFTALKSGAIDVLSRNTTWTISREAALGLNFAAVTYYDGQGFLVPSALKVESALELDGKVVCTQIGNDHRAEPRRLLQCQQNEIRAGHRKNDGRDPEGLRIRPLQRADVRYLAAVCRAAEASKSGRAYHSAGHHFQGAAWDRRCARATINGSISSSGRTSR